MEGYVKLHRESQDSSVFDDPKVWKVWCWCLMRAAWEPKKFKFGGIDTVLEPGDFITGLNSASKELKLSTQSLRTVYEYLKSTSRITIKSTNKFSIISILNWELYQSEINKQDNKQTNKPLTNQQQTTNNKEEREEREEVKNRHHEFVFLTTKEYQQLVDRFTEHGARARIESLNLYLGSKGVKYKSHYHTILSWERKENPPPKTIEEECHEKGYKLHDLTKKT